MTLDRRLAALERVHARDDEMLATALACIRSRLEECGVQVDDNATESDHGLDELRRSGASIDQLLAYTFTKIARDEAAQSVSVQ